LVNKVQIMTARGQGLIPSILVVEMVLGICLILS
jgi:hypothetical protein